jgi:superfamily I DNA and/or RNA helicase
LSDLSHVASTPDTDAPMIVIDTTGCDLGEEKDEGGSTRNEGEVVVVRSHLERLKEAGVKEEEIGILAPYNAQVSLLRDWLREDFPKVEIGTVDGFQGREKECIILTLVRSNARREVGFLADDRRLNVAITRAKRQVCVVCDCESVSSHGFIKDLVDYCEEQGAEYR